MVTATRSDSPDGIGLVLTAVVLAVGYDVGGYFVGRAIGRSPLSEASPNKTVEGLLGGMAATIGVGIVVVGIVGIDPFGGEPFGTVDAVLVAVAAAVVAPIGDLAESLMKRAAGKKDSGAIFPGHGGMLDQCALHLKWSNPIASRQNHIIGTPHKPEVAILIHISSVTSDIPITFAGGCGPLRVFPILFK